MYLCSEINFLLLWEANLPSEIKLRRRLGMANDLCPHDQKVALRFCQEISTTTWLRPSWPRRTAKVLVYSNMLLCMEIEYSWIEHAVQTHTKSISRKTKRAMYGKVETTYEKLSSMRIHWRGAKVHTSFFWGVILKNRRKRPIFCTAQLDAPCRNI